MTRIIGINHVALEVGDIDAALAWYGELSSSSCADEPAGAWPLSTWAISSSR